MDFELTTQQIVTGSIAVGTLVVLTLLKLGLDAVMKTVQKIHKGVTEIEDATNHRHARLSEGVVPPKLYDLALENSAATKELLAWKQSYDTIDPSGCWSTGQKAAEWRDGYEQRQQSQEGRLDVLENKP